MEAEKEPNGDTAEGRPMPDAVPRMAYQMARLPPGPMAALRRGPGTGAGSAAFWRLLTQHRPLGAEANEEGWMSLIQSMAILTPKGRTKDKPSAHNPKVPMGKALARAGTCEAALSMLLRTSGDRRQVAAVRMCRRLAGGSGERFDLRTLGGFVLYQDSETDRRIARDYYRERRESEKRANRDASEAAA